MNSNPLPVSQPPRLEAIFIAERAGVPMISLSSVQAVAGRGLTGDRYAEGTGYYSKVDPCEVTLIEAEILDRIHERFQIAIHAGEHRRNLVVRGLALRTLECHRFRIGEVLLEYDRPRPPCAYVQRLTQPGMTRALGEGAGIAARIIEGGTLHVGDLIDVLPEPVRRRRRLP